MVGAHSGEGVLVIASTNAGSFFLVGVDTDGLVIFEWEPNVSRDWAPRAAGPAVFVGLRRVAGILVDSLQVLRWMLCGQRRSDIAVGVETRTHVI